MSLMFMTMDIDDLRDEMAYKSKSKKKKELEEKVDPKPKCRVSSKKKNTGVIRIKIRER